MFVPIMLILVGLGTVVFHFISPWWWTPIASNWGYIDDTIILTFWVTGVVFVGLAVVLPVLGHATWHLYRKVVEY